MSYKIWTFEYEPKSLGEMIVDESIRKRLSKAIKEKPNIMLSGPPGIGKGTFTNIFLEETKLDRMKINASDETGIDNIRDKVKSFATSMGSTTPKIVVMNEADRLSPNAQDMLLDLMEQVHKITRFIFMCNASHKIIPEIHSRCQSIDLSSPPAKEIYLHCDKILKNEKIKVKNKSQIVDLIKRLYPDIRRIINTLQSNVIDGILDDIKITTDEDIHEEILGYLLEGKINDMRKVLKSNMIDYVSLYNYLYENIGEFSSPGDAIILISEYLYRNGFVSIKEINFMGMVTKMMRDKVI